MSLPKLPGILKIFYMTGLRYLPVVEPGDDRKDLTSSVVAFVSRKRLDMEMADLGRAYQGYDRIPESILVQKKLPADLITHLSSAERVPVLDVRGDRVAEWEQAEMLRGIAVFKERLKKEGLEPAPALREGVPINEEKREDGSAWLSRLILTEIPDPLFAVDMGGKTIFFNSAFEERLLGRPELKKSIRLAENYFQELLRNLLAAAYEEGEPQGDIDRLILNTHIEELGTSVTIRPLRAESGLIGYLYIFSPHIVRPLFEETREMIRNGTGLDEIMDRVESAMIRDALKKNGENISHTAESLGLKRTTLQNKIKRLNIQTEHNKNAT